MALVTIRQEELAQLRRDALRYRWFRMQHWDTAKVCAVVAPKEAVRLGHECPSGPRLDDIIDLGMDGRL